MEFFSTEEWDEALWRRVSPIYEEAFLGHGGKPEKIIRNMFVRKICILHVAREAGETVGMALTGSTLGSEIVIIDYLAVRKDLRGRGIGKEFIEYIKNWSLSRNDGLVMLIEVECEDTPENMRRIHFWQQCGFRLIKDYIHQYIWVPEPYQAMVYERQEVQEGVVKTGEEWFKIIERFHKESFRGGKKFE